MRSSPDILVLIYSRDERIGLEPAGLLGEVQGLRVDGHVVGRRDGVGQLKLLIAQERHQVVHLVAQLGDHAVPVVAREHDPRRPVRGLDEVNVSEDGNRLGAGDRNGVSLTSKNSVQDRRRPSQILSRLRGGRLRQFVEIVLRKEVL